MVAYACVLRSDVRRVLMGELPVSRVRGRECSPCLWLLRMLLRPFQRVLDGRARRRAAARAEDVEVAAEEVAEAGRARPDAEEDEAGGEDEREEDEDPLRLAPQAREEHRRLDARWPAGRCLLPGAGLGFLRGLAPR